MSTSEQQGQPIIQGQVVYPAPAPIQGQVIAQPGQSPMQQSQQPIVYAQPQQQPHQQGLSQPLTDGVQSTGIPGYEYSHTGSWRGGICDCCTVSCMPSCLMATFCACFPLGQLAQKADVCSFTFVVIGYIAIYVISIIIAAATGISITGVCGLFLFFLCLMVRGRIRAALAIPGDGCEDCCCSFWCTCCSIAQMARTVYNYREGDGCEWGEKGEPHWWRTNLALAANVVNTQPGQGGYPQQQYGAPQQQYGAPQQQYAAAAAAGGAPGPQVANPVNEKV